jgi:hypothetical protein
MNIFDPGHSQKYKEKMEVARKVNAERDQADRKAGVAAPSDTTDAAFLRNAISAIVAGVEVADWNCVCEGLDMLQQAELKIRKRSAGKQGS